MTGIKQYPLPYNPKGQLYTQKKSYPITIQLRRTQPRNRFREGILDSRAANRKIPTQFRRFFSAAASPQPSKQIKIQQLNLIRFPCLPTLQERAGPGRNSRAKKKGELQTRYKSS